jgi:hypothetical protein
MNSRDISYGGIKSIRYSGINLHIFIILIKNILKNLHIYVTVEKKSTFIRSLHNTAGR